MTKLTEKTISSERKYTGVIVNVRRDDVILSDGKEHVREVVEHPGGVVIIPITEDDKIVLIKQWRHPVGEELIELPAGKLDKGKDGKGEDPFLAAKRELEEETGYQAESWESLGYIYTTPGFSDEKLYLYKASNLKLNQMNLDWGEIIEPFTMDINEARELIKNGKIVDAKTIVGLNLI